MCDCGDDWVIVVNLCVKILCDCVCDGDVGDGVNGVCGGWEWGEWGCWCCVWWCVWMCGGVLMRCWDVMWCCVMGCGSCECGVGGVVSEIGDDDYGECECEREWDGYEDFEDIIGDVEWLCVFFVECVWF